MVSEVSDSVASDILNLRQKSEQKVHKNKAWIKHTYLWAVPVFDHASLVYGDGGVKVRVVLEGHHRPEVDLVEDPDGHGRLALAVVDPDSLGTGRDDGQGRNDVVAPVDPLRSPGHLFKLVEYEKSDSE